MNLTTLKTMPLTRFTLRNRGVKIFLLFFIVAAVVFGNHIFLVKAAIERALIVAQADFDYGVIHPQEILNQTLSINLSDAALVDDRVGIVSYEINQQKKCRVFGAGGACVEYEPSLCPYLSLVTTDGGDTGFASPNETEPYPLASGGIYKTFGEVDDDWTLRVSAPCFEGECREDYNAVTFGSPLPQSLKGQMFACNLEVRVTGVSSGIFQVMHWGNFLFPIAYAFEETVVSVTARFGDATSTGASNVAFLPGLEASRLYKPGIFFENQLWEPNRNADVEKLYLSSTTGESIDSGVYTRDVIGAAYGLTNIYSSFIASLDSLKANGTIHDWEALPYDWRFGFDDILVKGKKDGDNISYLESTSTPFILQELRRLADTSDTGKVTIITHSNGGLLAKYLLKKLADENDPLLGKIDKLIMIAAPQLGTAESIEGLLHGDSQQIPGFADLGFFMDEERARELGENMQSGYNLLPSNEYFNRVASPVIEFAPNVSHAYDFISRYGTEISDPIKFSSFLLGDGGVRSEPPPNDEESPNVLKSSFLSKAESVHAVIDGWVPPANIEVVQIAGWGEATTRGIRYHCDFFTCLSLSTLDRDLLDTSEGDGTVVAPSAVAMNEKRYYVNLHDYNRSSGTSHKHKDILEVDSLRTLIEEIVNHAVNESTLPQFISTTTPIETDDHFELILRSPVAIDAYDSAGNHTGLAPNPITGSDLQYFEAKIPNSFYTEAAGHKYLGLDTGDTYDIRLKGLVLGSFTLEIHDILHDQDVATTTFENIPVTASTTGAFILSPTASTLPTLALDVDGDGAIDVSLQSGANGMTIEQLAAILKGVVKTLHLSTEKEKKLIKKIEKLEKELKKEHKDGRDKKRDTKGAFSELLKLVRQYDKKGILTHDEATELINIIEEIQRSVLK